MATPHLPPTAATAPPRPRAAESTRLEALARYSIVGTPPEPQFDGAVEIAARLAGTPGAALTFVEASRVWIKATYGIHLPSLDRDGSVGQLMLTQPAEPIVIPDARADERLATHPYVAGEPWLRFCAGVPILTPGGLPIGTLLAVDTEPRDDAREVIDALAPAARLVAELLEQRRESVLAAALTSVLDAEGRFVSLSCAWERLLGLPAQSVVGRHFSDFVHPDDRERSLAELELNRLGRSTRGFENRYLGADGRVHWLAWDSRAVPEEGRIYALAKDITDLRESEDRYRVLAENATDMIARHACDARVEWVSPSCSAVLGYSREEFAGLDPYELIHPDDHQAVRTFHETLLNGTDHVRIVFRERHRDGHYLWVETMANLLRDPAGEPLGIQTITRDITEAKLSTEALQQAEERFRKAFEDAPIGMAIASDGAFQRVNRALADMLGYSETDLLRMSMPAVTHPDDVRSAEEFGRLLDNDARSVTLEKRLVRADGAIVWVSIAVSLMRDSDGVAAAQLIQVLDVSERHRAEAEARRAREAAERANRAKSAFLARMSHELRTPLNAILGFAQLLELEDLTDEQRDSAARIVRGGAHLVELIDDVLDISRIEAGELSVELGSVPVHELIEEVTSLLRPLASGREITLESAADAPQTARADRQRLKQILLNLVSNAIKYGPQGSTVRIVASGSEECVRLAVIDAGPGLTAEESERVFRPFERLPAHAYVEGTGLGLALSRNLARAMGGDVGVRSAGPGSEFWVELMADREPRLATEPPGELPPAVGVDGPRTLLYVEDSQANVEFTRRLLAWRPNVELVVACDVASGRRLAHERRPDAILLDVDLPDGDGGELLAELKADPETAAIPVVVVTADARRSQEDRVMAAGATAYAAKPIDVRAFMRTLDAALAG